MRCPILIQEEIDKLLGDTRAAAKNLGFKFPATAPEKKSLGPQTHSNHLAYTCLPSLFPVPLVGLLDQTKNITDVRGLLLHLFLCYLLTYYRRTVIRLPRTSWSLSRLWRSRGGR